MAQQYFKFDDYTAPMPDQDGYTEATSTTSTESSGRTQRGYMINTPIFSVEAYNMKWTNISAVDVAAIKHRIKGRREVQFYHFNTDTASWETGPFYVANINTGFYSLVEGEETCSELSFQITSVNPS